MRLGGRKNRSRSTPTRFPGAFEELLDLGRSPGDLDDDEKGILCVRSWGLAPEAAVERIAREWGGASRAADRERRRLARAHGWRSRGGPAQAAVNDQARRGRRVRGRAVICLHIGDRAGFPRSGFHNFSVRRC
jgi:hypothetical protein